MIGLLMVVAAVSVVAAAMATGALIERRLAEGRLAEGRVDRPIDDLMDLHNALWRDS